MHRRQAIIKPSYLSFNASKGTFIENQVETDKQNQDTVTNITKHDGEQEWEGDNGEETRVDLTVTCHSVGVHNVLESSRKLVRLVVSRWLPVCAQFVQDGRRCGS
jgi:hypothetical protein